MDSILRKIIILGLIVLNISVYANNQITVSTQSGNIRQITVESYRQYWLAEGDILISKNKPTATGVIDIGGKRWSNGVVPFKISQSLPIENILDVYRAMLDISFHTSIKFIEITKENNNQDFIHFIPSTSTVCASHVGKAGGEQNIILAQRCKKGSTTHEILHALGLWHEQSRADRDNYIQIVWENIKEEKKYNFSQHLNDGFDIGAYDYSSIMHYGPMAFSKNGKQTIVPLDQHAEIGQRDGMSELDISAINKMYSRSNF